MAVITGGPGGLLVFLFSLKANNMNAIQNTFLVALLVFLVACSDGMDTDELIVVDDDTQNDTNDDPVIDGEATEDPITETDALNLATVFEGRIDLDNLPNYASQDYPNYVRMDNTNGNEIQDEIAVLGRVLFYDKNLSSDNTVSCATCHQQAFAFGDPEVLSQGVNGLTGRHSMRLVNARFGNEERFFWDERAASLEEQSTMPIQDHIEMGFSGLEGDEDINGLIDKLSGLEYMEELFTAAYGDETVTETRMQHALAQFIRSIQSFDSRYDEGLTQAGDEDDDFSNFTPEENLGKALFMGRAGCDRCHRAPEFSIDDDSDNNGVITMANSSEIDLEVTRSPSLRDIFNAQGELNGPLMHDGSFATMEEVIDHYNDIMVDPANNNLDRRLRGGRGGMGQNLNLDDDEVSAIVAFIKTLSGTDIYENEKWSDPFSD